MYRTGVRAMSIAEQFRETARIIEDKGWCQGENTRNGKVCVARAMCLACGIAIDTPDSAPLLPLRDEETFKVLCRYLKTNYLSPWNDDVNQTNENVVKVLHEVADAHGSTGT